MAVLEDILSQEFVSDGNDREIIVPCDFDYINVFNITKMNTDANNSPRYEFSKRMTNASMIRWDKAVTTGIMSPTWDPADGFTVIDTTQSAPGPAVAVTAVANTTQPLVTTGSTSGLVDGSIVRMINCTNGGFYKPYNGIDFTIDTITLDTSFRLAYMYLASTAATDGSYRIIPYDPIYYPVRRTITSVNTGVTTEIFMSVTHGYTVGQRVTFTVLPLPNAQPTMLELNGLRAQILSINTSTNSITVNIDSSSFTAYAFPISGTAANLKFTPGEVIPFGDAPSTLSNVPGNQSVLDGATRNTGRIAISLTGGATSPGGDVGDLMRVLIYKGMQLP